MKTYSFDELHVHAQTAAAVRYPADEAQPDLEPFVRFAGWRFNEHGERIA